MFANESLFSRLSRIFGKRSNTRSKCRRFVEGSTLAVEKLEQRQLLAVSVFDVDQFEQNIRDYFEDNSVGFGYAINQGGVNVRSGGWGDARKAADGQLDFTEDTTMTLASVSKTITATAILKILQDTPGVGLDSSISDYLPASWTQGPNIASITFRELLTHDSGIRSGARTYAGLQTMINAGVTLANKASFSYQNANFALMRVMTPYLLGDGADADAAADPAQFTGDSHVDYIQDNVFAPMGFSAIPGPPASNQVLNYPYPGSGDPITYGDRTLTVGSGGWWLSADELALFLHGLRTNDSVLSPAVRQLMRDGFLGWMNPDDGYAFSQGMFGTYYSHGGDNPNVNTAIMDFPNGVQASLLINSETTVLPYQATALKNAFENAWPELSISGTLGNDTFEIRPNASDPSGSVDILRNGNVVVTRWNETLDALEFRGLSGNDTLIIQILPATVNLDLTFTGGNGDDTVSVTNLRAGVSLLVNGGANDDTVIIGDGSMSQVIGYINFVGGSGSDSMIFDDSGFINPRIVTINSTAVFRNGIGHVASYSGIETLHVMTGGGNDLVRLLSSVIGTDVEIESGGGNDHIVVGGGNASANINDSVNINVGTGDDKITLDDRSGIAAHDFYVFQEDYFQSGFIPVISWDAAPPDQIVLLANPQDSTTNIQGALSGVTLVVRGLVGDDVVNVHASSPGSVIHVNGGVGNDTLNLTPTTNLLDTIQGTVAVRGNHGANDRVFVNDQAFAGRPGRQYRVNGQNIDLVGSTFGNLYVAPNHGLERVDINASGGNDVFDVRSWSVSTLLYLTGNSGSDELRVASISHNVDSIVGDLEFNADSLSLPGVPSPDNDILTIYDDQRGGIPSYSVDVGPNLRGDFVTPGFDLTHFGVEQVTMFANDAGNYVNVGGLPSILHKASYFINVGDGNDTIVVRAVAAATVHAIGGDGFDILLVNGTPSDDYVTLAGDRMDLNQIGNIATTTVIRNSEIEYSRLNTDAGNDVLVVEGQSGLNEDITIQTSNVGSGWVSAAPFNTMHYFNLEDATVNGNASDNDTFQIIGTSGDDSIIINPVGPGTSAQPFVHMTQSSGGSLLRLRDATNVGSPVIRGGDGSDTFRVTMFPNGNSYPIRDMRLVAGEDSGDTDNDELIVSYNSNIFSLVSPPAAPENGLLQFDNNSDILDIVFENFEALSV